MLLSLDDSFLVVVTLVVAVVVVLPTLIMIFQTKCSFDYIVPNKLLSSPSLYRKKQRSKIPFSCMSPIGLIFSSMLMSGKV